MSFWIMNPSVIPWSSVINNIYSIKFTQDVTGHGFHQNTLLHLEIVSCLYQVWCDDDYKGCFNYNQICHFEQ